MMKNLQILLVIFLAFGCKSPEQEFYDTGELRAKYYLDENGEYQGKVISYYKNGQIEEEAFFEHGIAEGLIIKYDSLGNLYAKGNFANGKEEGVFEYFHPNGDLDFYISYKNGKKNGFTKTFKPDGKLKFESFYINDTAFYFKNIAKDTVYRSISLAPNVFETSSKNPDELTLTVYGPLEKNSRFVYTMYDGFEREMYTDSLYLKALTTKIKVRDFDKPETYTLRGILKINNEEHYPLSSIIVVDGGPKGAIIKINGERIDKN
jgi:hypothetical protein